MNSSNKKNVEKERHGRFNAIDFFLIVIFIVAVAVFVYAMFFSDADLFNFSDDPRNSREIVIVFEVEVDDRLLDSQGNLQFSVGDAFASAAGGYEVGEISAISERAPLMVSTGEYTEDENGQSVLVYAEYPGKGVYRVSVSASASLEDGAYVIGSNPVRVSESFGFTTPYFTGVCKCVSIEEVASNE